MSKRWPLIGTLVLSILFEIATLAFASDPIKVLVIPKGTLAAFWRSVSAGAQKAGSEAGVTVTFRGPQTEDQHQAQVQLVEYGIRQRYDAIVLAPNHVTASASVLGKAAAAGIKIVLIDSNMDSGHHACFIESDNYQAGRQAAEHMARLLDGAGDIALIRHLANHASTGDRARGFRDAIREDYPNMRIIADPYGGVTAGSAYHTALGVLETAPSIDGIFAVNEPITVGTLRAIREHRLQSKLKFIGFDLNETIKDAVLTREMDATIAQNPFQMGYLGVKVAHDLIRDGAVPAKIYTDTRLISADNYHKAKIQVIIKSNIIPE